MARRAFQFSNWTPTATADTSALANATYMAVKGGTTTQMIDILELQVEGMAGASAPTPLTYAHVSTLGITPTALAAPATDGPLDPSVATLGNPAVTYTAAGTGPQRSAATTDAKISCGINAFGGILRWNAAPGQQFMQLGNAVTAPSGECVLSCQNFGTAGLLISHIIFEPH
jgi:hypothetical protein